MTKEGATDGAVALFCICVEKLFFRKKIRPAKRSLERGVPSRKGRYLLGLVYKKSNCLKLFSMFIIIYGRCERSVDIM